MEVILIDKVALELVFIIETVFARMNATNTNGISSGQGSVLDIDMYSGARP